MSSPLPFVLAVAVAGFAGWQGLKQFNPEAVEEFTGMFDLLTGKSCAPDLLHPEDEATVYMPAGEDCKPVAEMIPAPNVQGEGHEAAVEAIVLTMVNPQALGVHRTVKLQRRFEAGAFLAEGETLPEDQGKRKKLMVGWLRAQGTEACKLLPKGFAATCQPRQSRTKVDLLAMEDGKPFLAEFTLTYSPAEPIGPLPTAEAAPRLNTKALPLAVDGASPLALQVETATKAAQAECAKLRAEHGNCMISALSLSETGDAAAVLTWVAAGAGN